MKWLTSLLTFEAVAMSLCHIRDTVIKVIVDIQ